MEFVVPTGKSNIKMQNVKIRKHCRKVAPADILPD
jgi:hypothetical protein